MIIRRSEPRDVPAILGFSRCYTLSPYAFDARFKSLAPELRPAFAEKMIQNLNAVTLVAEDGGRLAGYATVSVNPAVSGALRLKTGAVLLLAVDERLRCRGIGRRLVQNGLKILSGAGVRLVTVVTDLYNAPAIRVYESLGFRFVLCWHIYRYYAGKDARKPALQKNVAPVSGEVPEQFWSGFNRPLSLFKDPRLDRDKREGLRAYFIGNLKKSIARGQTAAFAYYQRNRPAGFLTVTEDAVAQNTLATGDRVCKIPDLIVPDGERGADVGRRLLADCIARVENCRLFEFWTDASDDRLITAAENAGFHLSYSGAAFHLSPS